MCLGSDCLRGSFSSEPMREWRWKCQWGEERKYSGYKNQIFVSGLLPSCKCPPFGGLTVCVQLHQQDRLSESKGENRKGGSRDTMRSLSFTHACPSLTAQKYHHLYPLSRRAEDKNQKWQQTYCRCINTAEQTCLTQWKRRHFFPPWKNVTYE